jgi:hypothetical protein
MRIETREITLTRQQIASVFRQEYKRSLPLWGFTAGSVVIVLALTAYGYYVRQDFVVLKAWAPFLGLVVIWWIYIVAFMPWSMARSPLLHRLLAPSRLIFTADAIEQELIDGTKKQVPYTSLGKVRLRENHALLYDQDGSYMVVPYSVFHSEEEAEQVKHFLAPNLAFKRDALKRAP